MISLETWRELFDFNYWARDRQLEACSALTPEQFVRPLGSSFSSVRDTLVHLLAVEWIWLERWRGRSPSKREAEEFAAAEYPALDALRARWHLVERDLREYLKNLKDDDLAQPFTYTNMQGQVWTYALWRALLHLLNHQTYHRGQITTLLRQLGAPAVPIDYLLAHDLHFSK